MQKNLDSGTSSLIYVNGGSKTAKATGNSIKFDNKKTISNSIERIDTNTNRNSIPNEKQAQKLAFQFKSASAHQDVNPNVRPSSILNSLL